MKTHKDHIILCCGRKGCPKLSKNKSGKIKIEDDFGGSIVLEEDEARLISKALDSLKVK